VCRKIYADEDNLIYKTRN